MRRLDPQVGNVSVEELKDLVFQGSWTPRRIESSELTKYHKLINILKNNHIQNRKICFISAPQLKPDSVNYKAVLNRRYLAFPHHGFMILSAAIRSFMPAWNVQLIDLYIEVLKKAYLGQSHDLKEVLNLIPNDCDLYGVSIMFESNLFESLQCMEYLLDKGKFVIAGGVQSTVDFENLLKLNYADIVVKKEGEMQLIKLLNLWERVKSTGDNFENNFQEFYNMSFRHGDEIISFEDKHENPISLDIRKEYKLIDLNKYNKYATPNIWARIAATGRKWATLLTNRGCRGNCIFCQVTDIMGRGVRSRSVNDVIEEILFLYYQEGVRHIEIIDDDFLGNRERALELLFRWADLNLDLTFSTGAGVLAISIDEEMANAMAKAGCVMTGFGIETGNEERLKSLGKPATLKKVREACDIFMKNYPNIWVQANFILGFPNETLGELFDTFNYAKSLKIDYCQSAILNPIVGTSIFEKLVSMKDERVSDRFGKDKMAMHSVGRGLVSRGLTFDDVYKEVYDFRKVELNRVATNLEVQQFQIFFNVFTNLVGSIHLQPGGNPEKIKSFTDDVLKAYPMDAVAWAVSAKASKMLGLIDRYDSAMKEYRTALKNSTFWTTFFEIYNIHDHLNL